MDFLKVKKNMAIGYMGAVVLLVLPFFLATIICGESKVMAFVAENPMLLFDVMVMMVILASVLIHICLADEYYLHSAFRVERKKYFAERMQVKRYCILFSTAIAIAFKAFVVLGTGQVDEIRGGTMILYAILVGMLYTASMNCLLLLFELVPVMLITLVYFAMPYLLFFFSLTKLRVWTATPANLGQIAALVVVGLMFDMFLTRMHKRHYETIDLGGI